MKHIKGKQILTLNYKTYQREQDSTQEEINMKLLVSLVVFCYLLAAAAARNNSNVLVDEKLDRAVRAINVLYSGRNNNNVGGRLTSIYISLCLYACTSVK